MGLTNKLQFTVTGAAKNSYAVEVSTKLSQTNWVAIFTNQSHFTFKDTHTVPLRFYRARVLP